MKNVSWKTIPVSPEKIKGFDSRKKFSESEHLGKVIRGAGCFCLGKEKPRTEAGKGISVPFLFRHFFQDVCRFLCGDFLQGPVEKERKETAFFQVSAVFLENPFLQTVNQAVP